MYSVFSKAYCESQTTFGEVVVKCGFVYIYNVTGFARALFDLLIFPSRPINHREVRSFRCKVVVSWGVAALTFFGGLDFFKGFRIIFLRYILAVVNVRIYIYINCRLCRRYIIAYCECVWICIFKRCRWKWNLLWVVIFGIEILRLNCWD